MEKGIHSQCKAGFTGENSSTPKNICENWMANTLPQSLTSNEVIRTNITLLSNNSRTFVSYVAELSLVVPLLGKSLATANLNIIQAFLTYAAPKDFNPIKCGRYLTNCCTTGAAHIELTEKLLLMSVLNIFERYISHVGCS